MFHPRDNFSCRKNEPSHRLSLKETKLRQFRRHYSSISGLLFSFVICFGSGISIPRFLPTHDRPRHLSWKHFSLNAFLLFSRFIIRNRKLMIQFDVGPSEDPKLINESLRNGFDVHTPMTQSEDHFSSACGFRLVQPLRQHLSSFA